MPSLATHHPPPATPVPTPATHHPPPTTPFPTPATPFPPAASRVDEAYHQILLRIVRGEYPGGTPLKSTQLARQMSLSRTPIVQALQRLAADGIVTLEVNKRAVVRAGAENWLVEIHELRELLEPAAALLAAGRIPREETERLQALAEAARPGERANWAEAARQFDYALHLAIAAHCGNLPLSESIRRCWSYKRLSYEVATEKPEVLERGFHEHLSILSALSAGDGPTASAAILFHLRSAALLRPAETIV